MTKKNLAIQLQQRFSISYLNAYDTVTMLLESMKDCLAKGDAVSLRGFGTIKPVHRKAKKARDIMAGKEVIVPAHKVVKFIPCGNLKKVVQ